MAENMTDSALVTTPEPRKLWVRALPMLLMCAAFQLAAWILVLTSVVQLVFAIFSDEPNKAAAPLWRWRGAAPDANCSFVKFATAVAPFPFSDWPQSAGS